MQTLTLDLMAEPVVTYHTSLAGIRESRFLILRDHFRRAPRMALKRHVLVRARRALPSDLALAAELEKRGYPKHWLALGVSAETPEALMFLCACIGLEVSVSSISPRPDCGGRRAPALSRKLDEPLSGSCPSLPMEGG